MDTNWSTIFLAGTLYPVLHTIEKEGLDEARKKGIRTVQRDQRLGSEWRTTVVR